MSSIALRVHVVENHRLVCGACRNDWRKVDSDKSWYGVCAHCGSDRLVVESEPVPGAPPTGEWELQCDVCGATWTGPEDDSCEWCERAERVQLEHQIDLLLTQPDINPDDANHQARMHAWADRLVNGVKAEIITKAQADTAWKRAIK